METNNLIGKRIKMVYMNDPEPIEPGQKGIIKHVGNDVINVEWDNGRTLGVIVGVDKYEILD